MRFGLVSRNNLTLVALFALAFGGAIVYVNATSRAQNAARNVDAPAVVVAQGTEPIHHGGSPTIAPAEPAAPVTADAEPAPASPQNRDPPLNEQQQQDLTRWSNQVVSAHVPEKRGDAIRELATMKNEESVRALAYALSRDEEPDNRLLAVSSLRSLARDGYQVGAVRDALRLAAADTDPNVADHAKEAYDELMRKDEAE